MRLKIGKQSHPISCVTITPFRRRCGCPACKLASLIAAADGDERYKKAPQEPAWGSLDQESYGELADVRAGEPRPGKPLQESRSSGKIATYACKYASPG